MKRGLEAEESPSAPREKVPSIQVESPPAETSAYSSNDLGDRLMNLPFELRQMILCTLAPKERLPLRLVNKAMRDAVDASMSNVQEIRMEFEYYPRPCRSVIMKTINPYNGAKDRHEHEAVSSSLPFLLKWAGAQLKTLEFSIRGYVSKEDEPRLKSVYRVFEALNSENICPKLKKLSLFMVPSLWNNNDIIFNELLKYITKRQLQAKAADHPFLHSLSLTTLTYPSLPVTSAVDPLFSEKRRKFLQDILDQSHGLKELEVDYLLEDMDLPIVALRYPTTLTHLRSVRLGKTPGDLQTIVDNCPNLQFICFDVGFPHDDANFRALPSLSDLRQVRFLGNSIVEEILRIFPQCLAAFEDHPFGASIARPWPQLKSVELTCYYDKIDEYLGCCLRPSSANCFFTSLRLVLFSCLNDNPYARSVEYLFKALNSRDTCSSLMELDVDSCELVYRIRDCLVMRKDCQQGSLGQWPDEFYDDFPAIPIPSRLVYGILNGLLTYVTKRQSAVRLGKPFIRSLSIAEGYWGCGGWEGAYGEEEKRCDQLEQIHTTLQQILDQCHGLEDLYIESLEHEWVNPDQKKGRELMELVPLRFPTTLKKLNGVQLD